MQTSARSSRPQLALVGPYPPPYGGIAVGIQRLARHLEANHVDFTVYNEAGDALPAERVEGVGGPRRVLLKAFAGGPSKILHYQSPDWRMRCLVALWSMLTGRKSVISIHGQSFEFSMQGPAWQRALVRFFLARTSAVIACNPGIFEQVTALAGARTRVYHVPAFILPPPSASDAALPPELDAFLAAHSPRILWVGWSELHEGRDVYGLDLTLDMLERLAERFPNAGCVLWFSGVRAKEHWERLWKRTVERGLDRRVFVQHAGLPEIFPLFRRCDAYLRPTITDGDSVSVREALALGTPVVASDAAPRPGGCVTFRASDADDFLSKLTAVLGDLDAARMNARSEPQEDNGAKILSIYRELGLLSTYWKKRKVLVTGAAGFIGSHLVERLAAEGALVTAFVHYNSRGDWGNLELLPKAARRAVRVVAGDLIDPRSVQEAVDGQHTVFHLGALIAIPYSYTAPASYVAVNIQGTLNVLEACRRAGTARMVHTSTSETYGTARYVPMDEAHPLQGQSPYSASKIGADKIAESYHLSFGLPVSTIRPFNCYGPRQSARAIIPTILTQLLAGKTTLRLGSLTPVRDFTYVGDTVDGFLRIAQSKKTVGEVVNVGSGRGVTIGEVVKLAQQVCGVKVKVVTERARVRPEKSEVLRLLCNSAKARRLTGWKPRVTLRRGLEQVRDYLAENLDRYKTDRYVV